MNQNPTDTPTTAAQEISLEEILKAANLLPSEGADAERIATALRALDW